jgi:pimeloyl-ACP methyl ester carboxylesterase
MTTAPPGTSDKILLGQHP